MTGNIRQCGDRVEVETEDDEIRLLFKDCGYGSMLVVLGNETARKLANDILEVLSSEV
jgi:hypothetical protein